LGLIAESRCLLLLISFGAAGFGSHVLADQNSRVTAKADNSSKASLYWLSGNEAMAACAKTASASAWRWAWSSAPVR